MKNILVIHPKDRTTNFLSSIYEDTDWTIITSNYVSKKHLKEQIKAHDIIIMLGHGSKDGLFGKKRFIIDSTLVYLLKDKVCHCIWCNANEFVDKYGLTGNFSGMIISEMEEALMCSVKATQREITLSNFIFAVSLKKHILDYNFVENMNSSYRIKNNYQVLPVIEFNRTQIYSNYEKEV